MNTTNKTAIEALPRYDMETRHDRRELCKAHEGEWVRRAAVLHCFTPPAQGSIDADGLPPMPVSLINDLVHKHSYGHHSTDGDASYNFYVPEIHAFAKEFGHAYVLADRAARQSAAPGERATTQASCAIDALDGLGYKYDAELGWLPPPAPSEPVPIPRPTQSAAEWSKELEAALPDSTSSEPVPQGVLEDALYVRYLLRNCLVVLVRSNAKSMVQEVREYLQTAIQDATGNLEAVATVVNPHPRNTMSWLIEPALPVGTKLYLSPPPTPATGATKSPDANIEKNRELLLQRSIVGLAKYGVTTADNPIPHKEWLQHALEESLDMANYLQAAINRPEPDAASVRKAALEEAVQACESVPLGHGDYTIMCEVVEAIRALINKEN